jgi:hypothetical protein
MIHTSRLIYKSNTWALIKKSLIELVPILARQGCSSATCDSDIIGGESSNSVNVDCGNSQFVSVMN